MVALNASQPAMVDAPRMPAENMVTRRGEIGITPSKNTLRTISTALTYRGLPPEKERLGAIPSSVFTVTNREVINEQ